MLISVLSNYVNKTKKEIMATDWFEEYESYPIVEKPDIKWNFTKDFQVQSSSIRQGIQDILWNEDNLSDDDLIKSSQYCYNLLSWAEQMAIMGFTGFQSYLDDLLVTEFQDKNIVAKIQKRTLEKWLQQNPGYKKIGENGFVVHAGCAYYQKLDGSWWLADNLHVFHIVPALETVNDEDLIETLNSQSKPSPYQQIYNEWLSGGYTNSLNDDHYTPEDGESTPEIQIEKAVAKIKQLLSSPVSLDSFASQAKLNIDRLEYLIKLSFVMVQFVQERRGQNEHTVYLFRDCVMFQEIHKTLDLLEDRTTSSDNLIVCRDLLTNSKRRGGHWYFSQEALFFAYEECPNDFDAFYVAYSRILRDYEDYSPEFKEFMQKLSVYVDEHIPSDLENNKNIDIVDLGFQGSINILLKYVIDNHCTAGDKYQTVINMTVLAEWFKGLYRDMYYSNTYSILTNIESLARNELQYRYKMGSFEHGNIRVVMGSPNEQAQANTELVVSTMTTLISKKLNLV